MLQGKTRRDGTGRRLVGIRLGEEVPGDALEHTDALLRELAEERRGHVEVTVVAAGARVDHRRGLRLAVPGDLEFLWRASQPRYVRDKWYV